MGGGPGKIKLSGVPTEGVKGSSPRATRQRGWSPSLSPGACRAEPMLAGLSLFLQQEKLFQCKWSVSIRTPRGAVTTIRNLKDGWVNPAQLCHGRRD